MKKDEEHTRTRNRVGALVEEGYSDEEIAQELGLEIGVRYKKKTVSWYKACIIAKQNQKKAFEKYGFALYSNAGKIAQKRHPWIGRALGKKYGHIAGKKRFEQIKASGKAKEYFSALAKKLQENNPDHSRRNMKKALGTMKENGSFHLHQKEATLKCMQKHPNQLKEMSKRVHRLYPDLAYRSRRKQRENSPYWHNGCRFDSNQEREVCKLLMGHALIDVPIEGKNVQFRIQNYEIDFFLKEKVFVEFHPPIIMGSKAETEASYFKERRRILDENGFSKYPLVLIPHIKKTEAIIEEIKEKYFSLT